MSPQFTAEGKAYWRALAALCPETERVEFEKQLTAGETSIDVVAAALHLPVVHARDLFRSDFLQIVQALL